MQVWITVPLWPPSRCTILRVVMSQIYTHRSAEPQQAYRPSTDQPPRISVFSCPWTYPLNVFFNLFSARTAPLTSQIRIVSSKELLNRYVPSKLIDNPLIVSWCPLITYSSRLSAKLKILISLSSPPTKRRSPFRLNSTLVSGYFVENVQIYFLERASQTLAVPSSETVE